MPGKLNRLQIAWRLAQDLAEGQVVNLGAGMPLAVSNFVPPVREVIFHSENGILGFGSRPEAGKENRSLRNAGNIPITLLSGAALFHHADSFAMIRGGHVDVSVLGAYEVAENGDLANWMLPDGSRAPAVGGAMDLATGARQVFVMMEHCSKEGAPRLLKHCTLPLTGRACVSAVYTDLAVIDRTADGLVVREMIAGMQLADLQAMTGANLRLACDWRVLSAPEIQGSTAKTGIQ